ncbi:papain-like cysteine protease family protein [Chitiniphilus shinanonensis]|uniref:papain-like cysteine protease family protein n=2 Tax=Chitiniphilus shinanonensis TaxID=553088 RepID=UPI003032139E
MPVIRANRESIDDRFSVLGFTIRTESPLFEVGIATDPELFKPERRAQRSRSNFYSSRGAGGAIRARRGEAVYLVPPDVLSNFVGQPRLYFGLAIYDEGSGGVPITVQTPTSGNMYVNITGLSGRGLRRLVSPAAPSAYGAVNGHDPSLEWGGDARPSSPEPRPANGNAQPAPAANGAPGAPAPYDDGFGSFPSAPAPASTAPAATAPATPAPTGGAPVTAQSVRGYPVVALDTNNRRPARFPGTGVLGSTEATIALGVLGVLNPGLAGTILALRAVANRFNVSIGIGPSASVGFLIGGGVGAGLIFAPGDQVGYYGQFDIRGGWIDSASVELQITIVGGGIDSFGGISWAIAAEVDAGVSVSAQALFNTSLQFQGVTFGLGLGLGVEPIQVFLSLQGSYASGLALAQGYAAAQPARRRAPLVRAQEILTPFYDPTDPSSALTCQNDAFSAEREQWFAGVPNTRIFPHSAICQLLMTMPDGVYQGTGFYIGRNRILTCAHNLAGASNVTIIPGRNGAGGKPFGETSVPSSSWRVAPGYTGTGNWANDLAVIDNVPLAAPNDQWFEFLNATPSDQLPIVVCGYSLQSVAVPELTQAIDGDKQHLHGGYAASQSGPEVIEYPILTLKGASGSPVYHISNAGGQLRAQVCAVHVTGEPAAQGLNRGCFITPRKIDWIEGRATSFALAVRALAIPLDPGEGGRSIGTDALQAGDIIVSTARHVVSYGIRAGTLSAVSHAMLYVGDGKVIEAVGDGVREVPLSSAIGGALLAVAYRDPRVDNDKAAALVAYARGRVGNPYNYAGVAFTGYRILNPGGAALIDALARVLGLEVGQAGAVYCSELVYDAFQDAGIPLSGTRPADSRPSDIVDLFGTRLGYVGHLIASDVPLGVPLSLGVARPLGLARGLSGESYSVHWDTTPYYPQNTGGSCWAASAAMVVGWRDNRRVTDQEISDKVAILDAYKDGLWPKDRRALADVWDLVAEPAASYPVDEWRHLLESYGPLYIDMTWRGDSGGHVRVLVGMTSDGAEDGSDTFMYMHDPWPSSPGRIKLSYADFLALYEGRTNTSGGQLQYQLLHASTIPPHARAVTAAPFSLETADSAGGNPQAPRFSRAPAPPPLGEALSVSGRSHALTGPGVAVEIASAIAGATMERVANNVGDITWELDQLRGMKHPNDRAPDPAPATQNGEVIRLEDWPRVSDSYIDDIYAGFEINWQYTGKSVGNVLISNISTNDAIGWGLVVKAKIMDDNIVYPRDNPTFAALRIRFEYRFTHVLVQDQIAIVDVRLYGNGTRNVQFRWEQTGMF